MTSQTAAGVEKIECCHLPQREICRRNPWVGVRTKIAVKQSLEHAIARQHLRGTIRLNDPKEKRITPDIFLECCGRHLSIDVKRWTATYARHERLYLSREFYGTARGEDSLTTFLKDAKRFLLVAFEFTIFGERRLVFVPGGWLQHEYELSAEIGINVDRLVESWPSFGKEGTRLYNIDVWKLIEIADQGGY